MVSCLDEDDDLVNTRDSESLEKNSLSSQAGADELCAEEDLIEEPSISLRQRMRSQELEMDCLLDEYEDAEDVGREEPVVEEEEVIEDDDEHEQSIIRQRMLEESVSLDVLLKSCSSTCPISHSRSFEMLETKITFALDILVSGSDSCRSCNRRSNLFSYHLQTMRVLEKF